MDDVLTELEWSGARDILPVGPLRGAWELVGVDASPVTEQSSLMVAALAFPGRQGRGIDTKIGWRSEER